MKKVIKLMNLKLVIINHIENTMCDLLKNIALLGCYLVSILKF